MKIATPNAEIKFELCGFARIHKNSLRALFFHLFFFIFVRSCSMWLKWIRRVHNRISNVSTGIRNFLVLDFKCRVHSLFHCSIRAYRIYCVRVRAIGVSVRKILYDLECSHSFVLCALWYIHCHKRKLTNVRTNGNIIHSLHRQQQRNRMWTILVNYGGWMDGAQWMKWRNCPEKKPCASQANVMRNSKESFFAWRFALENGLFPNECERCWCW